MSNDSDPSHAEARALAQAKYLTLLEEAGSPLLNAGDQVRDQLIGQFRAVYDAASQPPGSSMVETLSLSIGHARAATGIHPTASLAAANLIFAAALPYVTRTLARLGVDDPQTAAALRLNEAILRRMAAAADAYVGHLLARSAPDPGRPRPPVLRDASAVLTTRESEVLAAAAGGSPNRLIAEELNVSEATVKRHLATIYSKLDVRSRIQAVERARTLGLLTR